VGFSNSLFLTGLFSLLVNFGEGELLGLILSVDEGFLFLLGESFSALSLVLMPASFFALGLLFYLGLGLSKSNKKKT